MLLGDEVRDAARGKYQERQRIRSLQLLDSTLASRGAQRGSALQPDLSKGSLWRLYRNMSVSLARGVFTGHLHGGKVLPTRVPM